MLLLPLLPPLAKSQQVPLELQHLCARYLPMECNDGSDEDKEEHAEDGQVEEQCRTIAPFLGSEDHLLTCHICTGSSRSSRHRTAPPPPPPPTPRSPPSPSTPWSQLSVDGLSAVYITRELTRHWVSRARKSLPSANRQTHLESFRFQQFCEKPSIVCCRRENTVIISTAPTH